MRIFQLTLIFIEFSNKSELFKKKNLLFWEGSYIADSIQATFGSFSLAELISSKL